VVDVALEIVLHKIICDLSGVAETLQSTVHVAGVAEVLQSYDPPSAAIVLLF
jgi:hypothetical protein